MFEAIDLSQLPFDLAKLAQFDLLASVLLFVVLWIARRIALSAIRSRTELPPHDQRRLIVTSRNIFLFLLVVGLVLIWAPQLRTFALSLTAVAVAIVVATKELILCLSGAVLRATSKAFEVGDRIEVGEARGEVTDHTLLATTLQAFGAGANANRATGRTIVLPNSLFLTTPVHNQTLLRENNYHTFDITLDPMPTSAGTRGIIEDIVQRHYEAVRKDAARANSTIEQRIRLDLPDPSPTVHFRTSDLGKLRIEITFFCPTEEADRLEDDMTWDVLMAVYPSQMAADADSSRGTTG